MTLRERLSQALKEAMKAKDKRRISTLRLILAAIKDRDIARRTEADARDDDVIISEILAKMIRQRQESARAYEEGGRLELAEQEREEIGIIEDFLPRQLSDAEIDAACDAAIAEAAAESLRDIGRCMEILKSRYAGRMDFSKASRKIRERLSGGS